MLDLVLSSIRHVPMSKLSRRHRVRSPQDETHAFEGMRTVYPHAASVDSGAHEIMASVPDGDA
jgi:hypothetical protein